jgi:hypothetical protein
MIIPQLISIFLALIPALTLTSAQSTCNRGAQKGKFCLSDCKGNGIYISSPDLVTSIDLPQFKLEFNPNDPWSPKASANGVKVGIQIPPALQGIEFVFTGAGSSIDVGLPNRE